MDKPLISVIIPVYNSSKFLNKSIQSIVDQTYKNLEIIIIEDCSTDNSLEILNSFEDSRIKLLQNEKNKGVAKTLNRGLDIAKGKYICRHDSDDISLINRIEIQVDLLEKNETVIVSGSDFKNQFSDGRATKGMKSNNNLLTIVSSPVHHPTTMYRNDFITKHKIRYEHLAEDYVFWNKIFQANQYRSSTFYNIREELVLYNIHPNQETALKGGSFSSFILENQIEYYKELSACFGTQLKSSEIVNLNFVKETENSFFSNEFIEYERSAVNELKQWIIWNLLFYKNQDNNVLEIVKIYSRNKVFGLVGYLRLLKKYLWR